MLQKETLSSKQLDSISFLAWDEEVQQRYETLRAYMLLPYDQQQGATPVRFCLARFTRYGFLGLLDQDPLGRAWGWSMVKTHQVELVSIDEADTSERMNRLFAVLYRLTTKIPGGDYNATCGTLRKGFYGNAGERADHPEPASSYHSLR
jgi:hypothetical protein